MFNCNRFEQAAAARGSLSKKQEAALVAWRTQLPARQFNEYRRIAGVGMKPLPRLSKAEAYRLLEVIYDGEAGQ